MNLEPRRTLSALVTIALLTSAVQAHKAVTSRFTYNADVFPIFLSRCGRCHVGGGVGPMSLVTYREAFPWAESLRIELLAAGAAQPQGDIGAGFVRAAHRGLTARELDVVLDWALGGTPEGDAANAPPAATLSNDWAGPRPDLVLRPDAPVEIPAGVMELTSQILLPAGLDHARTIEAIDLLPGTPAVVRDVAIELRAPDGGLTRLGTWVPRQVPGRIEVAQSVAVAPGAAILATIHYKKTWQHEGEAMRDLSAVGLYFRGQ